MEKIKQNLDVSESLPELCINRKMFESIIKNKSDIIIFYDYDEATKELKKGDVVNLTLNYYDWDSKDKMPNLLVQIVSIGHFDYHSTAIAFTPVSLDVQIDVHAITGEELDSTFEAIAKSLDNESKK